MSQMPYNPKLGVFDTEMKGVEGELMAVEAYCYLLIDMHETYWPSLRHDTSVDELPMKVVSSDA